MAKMGSEYEKFVQNLQQALLDSEPFSQQRNISIERNKKLFDNAGVEREFDLYWEYELAGVTYKTIIECKDYTSKVSIDKIDALIGKIRDLPDLRPIFATKTGYQSGAETKARHNKIDLLIVREQTDKDWEDKNGTPFIKAININIHALHPAKITSFKTEVDKEWVEANTDIDTSKELSVSGMTNEIIIDNHTTGEKYSLYDLEHKLRDMSNGQNGELTHNEIFQDAYITYGETSIKLRSYSVNYILNPISVIPMNIDFSKELKGVIEYLHTNKTTAVFHDRIIKDWKK